MRFLAVVSLVCTLFLPGAWAQSPSVTPGSVSGVVVDPSGAAIPGASVQIENLSSGFHASATSDAHGRFVFTQVPPHTYHLSANKTGFQHLEQDVNVQSALPVSVTLTMSLAEATTSVTVHSNSADLIETQPTQHTDISNQLISRLPTAGTGQGLSSVITNTTPGVVADSNGMFHPLGEHSDTAISLDGQPITDQQSKTFSNQLSMETVQSIKVISGVPPAEYGDKTSLVVQATTKSGMGSKPNGSLTSQYGSFGTWNESLTYGQGNSEFGNFMAATVGGSGRYLDTPELQPLHDHGNAENIFDRIDFAPTGADMLHLNLSWARSWFQIPNDYIQQAATQDQRQQVQSFNIAPGWVHVFSPTVLLNITPYVRRDQVQYFPSGNPFNDQPATVNEDRHLTNAGIRAQVSYVKGIHDAKFGVEWQHTLLSEHFGFGLTDPAFNAVCLDSSGTPVADPSLLNSSQCSGAGFVANPDLQSGLVPYDLTRGGVPFEFRGHADIKEEAVYGQDQLTLGAWTVSLGLRGDRYDGLSHGGRVEPRIGVSRLIRSTGTVLQASWGLLFETPYNENLVLSSSTGAGGLASNVLGAFGDRALAPGRRSQYNVGLAQAFDRHFSVNAQYFWKFTSNDFDFDTLFNSPITFPIEWRKSKLDGLAIELNLKPWHGVSGYTSLGHTRARFFGPEVGGILFNSPVDVSVFRIDHDEALEQSTHVQYQWSPKSPWIGLTWRYDSGAVAGAVPDFATALTFNGDQQAAMGLYCGSQFATVGHPITSCSSPVFGATRINIPPDGTYNADTNPTRIAPRNLFDLAVGDDSLFHTGEAEWGMRLSVLNLTNKDGLYNFLSTFSGTHFLAPRTWQAELDAKF
jgi:hypothetical protein